jgi:DNA polymerase-3 subunit epsilon
MPWNTKPFTVFDTETTGPLPEDARIVTACVATVNTTPAGCLPQQWLVDPGVEIPTEATAVHGITTEHARAHGADPAGAVAQIAHALHVAWTAGMPVIGYNVAYDLTVLDAELRRHGHGGLTIGGPVIDPLVLDRALDRYRRGSRKLEAACAHYQVRLDGAHDAAADALAAGRVAWRIAQLHPHIAAMPLPELHAFQVRAHAAWASEFEAYLRRQGKPEVIDPAWPLRTVREDQPA